MLYCVSNVSHTYKLIFVPWRCEAVLLIQDLLCILCCAVSVGNTFKWLVWISTSFKDWRIMSYFAVCCQWSCIHVSHSNQNPSTLCRPLSAYFWIFRLNIVIYLLYYACFQLDNKFRYYMQTKTRFSVDKTFQTRNMLFVL